MKIRFVLVLIFTLMLHLPSKGQDTTQKSAGSCLFPEIGYAFPSVSIISLGLNYIHPSQFGVRFTYRKYFAKSKDEPADFRRCGYRFIEQYDAPPDEADFYELVMMRLIHLDKKIAVLLEAGPHLCFFNEMHFWRTNGSISDCYNVGHTRYMLGGISAYGGFDVAISRYFGIQAGMNALFNSKRQILLPEISLVFGKVR